MASRDLHHNIKTVLLLSPQTITADTNTVSVDTAGYESVELVVLVGASGDTLSSSVSISLEMEESAASGSGFTDVAENGMLGPVSGTTTGQFALIDDPAEDEVVVKAGYIGQKQYVRGVINVTGTHTNGTPIGVVAVLSHPRHAPVA